MRAVLGRLGNEVADAQAHRESGGRWAVVLRLGRRTVHDGRGELTEPAELVVAAIADGRLAELLGTPVEVLDNGPTVTISATIPGHLAPAVHAAILAAAPDATVTSPRRSTERTLTITTPQAPKDTE
ncbi:MAG: hypothetical protein JWN03_5692 [Nocardia sp.]|nr:hypothetical protein [Nocardia sp.]